MYLSKGSRGVNGTAAVSCSVACDCYTGTPDFTLKMYWKYRTNIYIYIYIKNICWNTLFGISQNKIIWNCTL